MLQGNKCGRWKPLSQKIWFFFINESVCFDPPEEEPTKVLFSLIFELEKRQKKQLPNNEAVSVTTAGGKLSLSIMERLDGPTKNIQN